MKSATRICTRCVMDTSDPEIVFDANGVCHHCHAYDAAMRDLVFHGEDGRRRLEGLIATIKRDGRGQRYDCIIGLSGGVDSTFVALKVKELGLRPLAVHLDNGWDSEIAVRNIHRTLETLSIDLHTHVIDWEEFKQLQLAFLRSSTPDSEVPSDHAILALMFQAAGQFGIRHIITGVNRRTESHMPSAWSQGHYDWKYIHSVHRSHGSGPLRTFPHMTALQLTRYMRRLHRLEILNYVDYVKKDAIQRLEAEVGWRDYGGKHFESIYTRFYQGYILPKKFGFDKRKCHLSSLICAGEIGRAEALERLKEEPYPIALQNEDVAYVRDKFGLSEDEFTAIMDAPLRSFWDYPSYAKWFESRSFRVLRTIKRGLTSILGSNPSASPAPRRSPTDGAL